MSIALGAVMLLLISFTFIPFGVNYEGVVNLFDSMVTQQASRHAITATELKKEIEASTGLGNTGSVVLVFPFKAFSGEPTRITSFVNETRSGVDDGGPHTGTDIAGNQGASGQTLLACTTGIVAVNDAPDAGSWGNMVIIYDKSTGLYYRYCHMKYRSTLKVGSTVQAGQVVGYCGATSGGSPVTGPHLHFEIFIPVKGHNQRIPDTYLENTTSARELTMVNKLGMLNLGGDPRYVTSIFCPKIKYTDVNYPTNLVLAASVKSTMGFPSKLTKYTGS